MAVKFISHRGESLDAPENTLPAFALSLVRNSDGMECDIYFTADKYLVCNHDGNTFRVSGEKVNAEINDTTFADLQKIDVSNNRPGFVDTHIPLWQDTLQYLGGREYYVEIKRGDVNAVPELIRQMDESGIPLNQFTMISFGDEVVKAYKETAPERRALLLIGGNPTVSAEEAIERIKACKADGLDLCGADNVDKAYVDKIHAAGYTLDIWTVDDPEKAQRFIGYGVDGITSNCAAKLKDMFARR